MGVTSSRGNTIPNFTLNNPRGLTSRDHNFSNVPDDKKLNKR